MRFANRTEAGRLLAERLVSYKDKNVIVYGLPRGGVVTAVEIARFLHAPLDLIIARKITHPNSPEYAIAATAENGHIVGTRSELELVDKEWLENEIEKERREAKRRKETYLHGKTMRSPEGKIAILVDDGVATGLTLRVGILELRHHNPQKLVVAVPVVSKSTFEILKKEADEIISLEMPSDDEFLGAVGSYYEDFDQVEDEEVISILAAHEKWLEKERGQTVFTVKSGKLGHDVIDYDEW